jgi:hypothetical protein
MASFHLVKRPEITKIYLFPCFVSGSGPKISTVTLSIGFPEIYVPSEKLIGTKSCNCKEVIKTGLTLSEKKI